jgi:hypothetical protein
MHIEISAVAGTCGMFFIYINKFYLGQIGPGPEYRIMFQKVSPFYGDELYIIQEDLREWERLQKQKG